MGTYRVFSISLLHFSGSLYPHPLNLKTIFICGVIEALDLTILVTFKGFELLIFQEERDQTVLLKMLQVCYCEEKICFHVQQAIYIYIFMNIYIFILEK